MIIQMDTIFYIYIFYLYFEHYLHHSYHYHYPLLLYMSLIMNSITRSLKIVAILTKNRDQKQMFLSMKLYIQLTHARSSQSLFFVKITTMFLLLVILFIIKLYARNDLFKKYVNLLLSILLLLLLLSVLLLLSSSLLLVMFIIRYDLGENQFLYYSSSIVYPYLSDLI